MPLASDVKLGDIVYPRRRPGQVGIAVKIVRKSASYPSGAVVIKTINGKLVTATIVNRYSKLVEEHRRKFEHHSAVLAMLQALLAEKAT